MTSWFRLGPSALGTTRSTLRIVLGLIFLGAGIAKLIHPADFLAELLDYRVPLPALVWHLIAASLPWLEIVLGAALCAHFWLESVFPLTIALAAVFVAMLLQAVLRGLPLDCGCFGSFLPRWTERPPVALARAIVVLGWSALSQRAEPTGEQSRNT